MSYSFLPKIELHLHLDCSLSYQVANRLQPGLSYVQFKKLFIAPPKCKNLQDYLERAKSGVALMQSVDALQAVTNDLFDQLAADNVLYAEIRFAPLLHIDGGIKPEEVVRKVSKAATSSSDRTGVKFGLILCTLRHFTQDESMRTVQLVHEFADRNVVGFDIAGDEAGFDIKEHMGAFDYAHRKNLNVTAHAGEACGPESIWKTIKHFRPSRIGHGVRCVEDMALMDRIVMDNIHLEICPTSNVQTDVCRAIHDHPIKEIVHTDISFSINTDARTISDTTLEKEYELLEENLGFDLSQFVSCNMSALEHAFQSEANKFKLIQSYKMGIKDFRANN